MKLLIIPLLLFTLLGCGTPTSQPTLLVIPTALPSPTPDLTKRDEFMAQVVTPRYVREQPSLIFSSTLVSEQQLFLGASIKDKDIQKCWMLEADAIRDCAEGEAAKALACQPATGVLFPAAYFAVASEAPGEALILLDYYAPLPIYATDPVPAYRTICEHKDGWRIMVVRKDGEWQVKSARRSYVMYSDP